MNGGRHRSGMPGMRDMYCEKCGNRLIQGAIFCTKCGARVEACAETAEHMQQQDGVEDLNLKMEKTVSEDDNSHKKLVILLGVLVVILLAVIGMAVALMVKKSEENKAEQKRIERSDENDDDENDDKKDDEKKNSETENSKNSLIDEEEQEADEKVGIDDETLTMVMEAYQEYLDETYGYLPIDCHLICVSDDIPDLMIRSEFEDELLFLQYTDHGVSELRLPKGNVSYAEKKGLIRIDDGIYKYQGYTLLYQIGEGSAELISAGTYTSDYPEGEIMPVVSYDVNGISVSDDEYWNYFEEFFGGEEQILLSSIEDADSVRDAGYIFRGMKVEFFGEVVYLINRFEMIDGMLYISTEGTFNDEGLNSVCYEVSPECEWYRYYINGERGEDISYEIVKEDIDSTYALYAADRENYVTDSATVYMIKIVDGVIVEVYSVNS